MKTGLAVSLVMAVFTGFAVVVIAPFPLCLLIAMPAGVLLGLLGSWYDKE